jgi:hypothetical protein
LQHGEFDELLLLSPTIVEAVEPMTMEDAMLLGQNVLAHGADPTGQSNSRSALLAAVNALPSNGGIVYIPAGRYRIDGGPVTVNKAIYFWGAGGVLRTAGTLGGSVTTLIFPGDSDGFDLTTHGVKFENLAIIRAPRGFARRAIYARRTFTLRAFTFSDGSAGSTSTVGRHRTLTASGSRTS